MFADVGSVGYGKTSGRWSWITAPAATADDIALLALMTAGIALVVLFGDVELGKYLRRSLQL